MAFVKRLVRDGCDLKSVHPTSVECKYFIGERDGKKILQLNTYGSDDREIPGKLSQTLQFDEEVAKDLWILLQREFNFKNKDQ